MKILLANAPWKVGNRLGVRAGCRWPFTVEAGPKEKIPDYVPFPFFLAYTTSVINNLKDSAGITAVIIDAIAEGLSYKDFIARVEEENPDLVVLETSTPSIHIDLKVSKKLKEKIGKQICLCGPHVSVFKEKILEENPFIDYVAYGEFEYTIRDLAIALKQNSDLGSVKGLIYRSRKKIVTNEPRPIIKNINELPWPERDSLPMLNYRDANAGIPLPGLQVVAGRGCPFNCSFCLWPSTMLGHMYRTRDPADVVDEIEYCVKKWKYRSFYFDDDTFNIGEKRIIKLCREIKKRKFNMPWEAMARADTATPKMLRAMKDAGLHTIKYGVESGNQEILNRIGKRLDLKKVEENVALTKKLGINVHLTFTFGLPGETWDTINKTIEFMLRLDPDSVQISINVPFPGTPYFEELDKKGLLLTKDWSKYDGYYHSVMRTEELSAEDLKKAVKIAHRKWTFRKMISKRHYIIQGIRHPVRAYRFLKRRLFMKEIY